MKDKIQKLCIMIKDWWMWKKKLQQLKKEDPYLYR